MCEKKQRDMADKEYEKSYFKPHFGPEETVDTIALKNSEEA